MGSPGKPDDFSLVMGSAADPFHTCLIGVPWISLEDTFQKWVTDLEKINEKVKQQMQNKRNQGECLGCWFSYQHSLQQAHIIANLTKNATLPLQELQLYGSLFPSTLVNVTPWTNYSNVVPPMQYASGSWVFFFRDPWKDYQARQGMASFPWRQNISGHSIGGWNMPATLGGAESIDTTGGKVLPPGVFLICGDRAWNGILHSPTGGLCYLGKLTMFAPSIRAWKNIMASKSWKSRMQNRYQRSVSTFDKDCNDKVNIMSLSAFIPLAIFNPGCAAAHSYNNLKKLACWSEKEFNRTSHILNELLTDVDSIRHAVLQNRATIDFLLLVHGHGCEEFEGMCCMNLSDHSQSIHRQLLELQDAFQKIQIHTDSFSEWLSLLSLTGWLGNLVQERLRLLATLVTVAIIICCGFGCIRKALEKVVHQAWLVQEEKGGIVEQWLSEQGHVYMHNPSYISELSWAREKRKEQC
ncbi:uncharacterized protein LOC121664654 [Corvus kubaryi]|uniref:uncharacterized protein LOC121664654 n=1 Tax=Corvus kubaryi TaxID=68294 RepID=UPI001C05A906|nr:uncharacterized protein LOC121664654 [Corvus kubaryi]